MARIDHVETGPTLMRRLSDSVIARMVVFVLLIVLIVNVFAGGTGSRVQARQLEFLTDAVRRSAVQCYALEGRFPDNLSYLEEHYGLIIDHDSFFVYYEPMGSNLIPQIRVIPIR